MDFLRSIAFAMLRISLWIKISRNFLKNTKKMVDLDRFFGYTHQV